LTAQPQRLRKLPTAALALSAANGDEAYAALTTDVGGRLTSMRIDGVTRAIDFLAETFNVTAEGGNGISYSAATKIFKLFGDGQKTMMMASGGIRFWSGPSSVADGSETAENGVIALGPGVPGGGRFNGQTLSGPFDSGASGAIKHLTGAFQNIAEASKLTLQGAFLLWPEFYHQGSGAPDGEGFAEYSIDWQIVSANASGGDVLILKSGDNVGQGGFGPSSWGPMLFAPPSAFDGIAHGKTGQRRIILQARLARGLSASLTNYAVKGFYAA